MINEKNTTVRKGGTTESSQIAQRTYSPGHHTTHAMSTKNSKQKLRANCKEQIIWPRIQNQNKAEKYFYETRSLFIYKCCAMHRERTLAKQK
jgi:hypothetical protein